MANTNRLTKRYLEHLANDKDELYQQGLEPLLRYFDANAPLCKRIGYSTSPKQDAFRLGQTPLLHFHSSAFTDVKFNEVTKNYKVKNSYLGLFGINGSLPTHLTEYAVERKYRHKDDTLAEFIDIFHHRFLSLFYRAWADAQPHVSHDLPETDFFKKRLSVFYGETDKSNQAFFQSNDVSPFLAGLLSQKNRSAATLTQMISEYIKHPVTINEFEGEWYELSKNEQTSLGRNNASLGLNSIAGSKVYQRGFNFSVSIGPLDYQQYSELLNNPEHFRMIKKLVIGMVGAEYSFAIKLVLKPQQQQQCYLGKAKLGVNSWSISSRCERLPTKSEVAYQRAC